MARKQSATQTTYNGFHYETLRRDGQVALFRKFKKNYDAGFEVVILRLPRAPFMAHGKLVIPKYEQFPRDYQWGTQGWTYRPEQRQGCSITIRATGQRRKNAN